MTTNREMPAPEPMTVSVIDCGEDRAEQWDAFVAASPDGTFYHLHAWQEVNRLSFGHRGHMLAGLDAHGGIAGIFPVTELKSRLFGRLLCSMPFVNYGGPCARDAATESLLLKAASDIVDRERLDYLEIRSARALDPAYPSALHKVSMVMPLPADADTVWNAFKSKHRTNVRRAYKSGFECRAGGMELLDDFYLVMAESWRAHGTPIYAKSYFRRIVETFGDRIRIFVVYQGDRPAATAFNGNYKGVVEGMWAGIRPAFRHLDPNYVLYWEMIKDSCERGMSLYHFGRSTVESNAESFKKKWNIDSRQLYWHYYLPTGRDMPALNVENPKYRLAISAWRRLPLAVTTALGPYLARSIP